MLIKDVLLTSTYFEEVSLNPKILFSFKLE